MLCLFYLLWFKVFKPLWNFCEMHCECAEKKKGQNPVWFLVSRLWLQHMWKCCVLYPFGLFKADTWGLMDSKQSLLKASAAFLLAVRNICSCCCTAENLQKCVCFTLLEQYMADMVLAAAGWNTNHAVQQGFCKCNFFKCKIWLWDYEDAPTYMCTVLYFLKWWFTLSYHWKVQYIVSCETRSAVVTLMDYIVLGWSEATVLCCWNHVNDNRDVLGAGGDIREMWVPLVLYSLCWLKKIIYLKCTSFWTFLLWF